MCQDNSRHRPGTIRHQVRPSNRVNHPSPEESASGSFPSPFPYDSYLALRGSRRSGKHPLAHPPHFLPCYWNGKHFGLFNSQIFCGFHMSFKELAEAMWITTWKYFPVNTEAILTIASQEEVTARHGKDAASCWLGLSLGGPSLFLSVPSFIPLTIGQTLVTCNPEHKLDPTYTRT